jgi:hypothetical protein
VSPTSPGRGAEAKSERDDDEIEKDEPPTRPNGPVEIELEVSRQRAAGWAVFGLIVGALLIWKLGTVGVWVGVVLMVIGAFRAWELVQTFLYPPGTISVTAQKVTLPRGLCLPKPIQVTPADVTAVYFLRRSVPWNRSAPVLIVEIGSRAMAFPRDWFASEADQRHVVHALMRGQTGAPPPTEGEPAKPSETVTLGDASRGAWGHIVGGVALIGVGAVATAVSGGIGGPSGGYAVYIGPMVAGVILLWRGFTRW